MHDRYVAHILFGAELRLHRFELADLVPLPPGDPCGNFLLTADDELRSCTPPLRLPER
jgi:hypothetical protein